MGEAMEIDEVAESEPEEEGEDEQQSLIWASAPNIGICEGVHIAKSLFRPCVNHWLTRSGETFNFQRTGIVIYNSPLLQVASPTQRHHLTACAEGPRPNGSR